MALVYSGSHINMAASWAKDGSEGLTLENPSATAAIHFPSPTGPGYRVARTSLFVDGIGSTNLSLRAWCFRERLLALRTLFFGCKNLIWQCQMKTVSDFFPNGIPDSFLHTRNHSTQHPKTYLAEWEHIVGLYIKCESTYQTDKVVALSAVARIAQEMRGDEYIAGMWRSTQEKNLLWECKSEA